MQAECWTFENTGKKPVLEIFLTKGPRFFPATLDKVDDPVYTPGHATGNGADETGNGVRRVISSVG
ncbi:MAG: hypothetical protein ACOVOA_14130, partial [Allorhizobium sp.]